MTFSRIMIEGWNEIFLLIVISIMMIGVRHDKTDESLKKIKIPLTYELTLFFAATLIYNLCDIIIICFGGMPTDLSYYCIRIGVFGHYTVGEFQTLLFLLVIRKYIAEELDRPVLKGLVTAFLLLQIPNILLLVITPFTDFLYHISPDNNYVRSWGYLIWQSITIVTFVFIALAIVLNWKRISVLLKRITITAAILTTIPVNKHS